MNNHLKPRHTTPRLTYRQRLQEAIENMAKTEACLTLFDQAIEEARSLAVSQFLSGDRAIGPQLQQAKKEAMLVAATLVPDYTCTQDHGDATTRACTDIEALLRAHHLS